MRITIFRFFAAMRPDVSPAGGAHFISARAFLLLLPLVTLCAEAAAVRPFSVSENQVLTAYIAYYGRPADGAGLAYWADRLERAGGDLGAIMQAFGSSQEFTDRFSGLSSQDLVSSLYRQLLARDPDPAGLAYYVAQLDSGAVTLQTIALDVIYGVQNDDVAVVQNRLDVSRYFVAQLEALGPVPEEIPADQSAGVLSTVTADPASRDAAYGQVDALVAALPRYAGIFRVTKTEDTADGVCDADCSLREAVIAANAKPGLDLVVVPPGNFVLQLDGPSEVSDRYKDLEIYDDLHIAGAGSDKTTIDGGERPGSSRSIPGAPE